MERCWLRFDQRCHAEQWGRRRTEPDAMPAAAQPELQSLSYLVFDRHRLVAAFARRDDAEQWIEEFGHPTMELREMGKRGKAVKPNAGGR